MKSYDPISKHMQLCVHNNTFWEYHKAVQDDANVIATYSIAFKCLNDLFLKI